MRDAVDRGMAAKGLSPRPGADVEPAESGTSRSWGRWMLGWVLAPLILASIIVVLGVHVGATRPEGWLARILLAVFG